MMLVDVEVQVPHIRQGAGARFTRARRGTSLQIFPGNEKGGHCSTDLSPSFNLFTRELLLSVLLKIPPSCEKRKRL